MYSTCLSLGASDGNPENTSEPPMPIEGINLDSTQQPKNEPINQLKKTNLSYLDHLFP